MNHIEGHTAPLSRICVTTACGRMRARTNNFPPPAGAATVLCVHGLVISSRYMVPTAQRLAALCRVYAVDLPGYGESEKPRRTPSLQEAADSVAAFMDALAIPTAHVLGNSYGCQVAAEFAVRHPHRLQRLVLQGLTVNPHQRHFWAQLGLWLKDLRCEPLWLNVLMARDWCAAGLRRGLGTIRNALDDRIESKLPVIRAPTLIVRGGNDPKIPQDWAEEAATLLPNGQLRVIPGYGHCLIYIPRRWNSCASSRRFWNFALTFRKNDFHREIPMPNPAFRKIGRTGPKFDGPGTGCRAFSRLSTGEPASPGGAMFRKICRP